MGPEELCGTLITTICEKQPQWLVELLLSKDETIDDEDKVKGVNVRPTITAYPYPIKTKYFTADTCLYTCTDATDLPHEDLCQFEALIVIFDAHCDNFKEKSETMLQLADRCVRAEVNLAVCSSCDDEVIRKTLLKRLSEFELIETEAEDSEDCGMGRLKEALEMYTWSNMVLHERQKLPPTQRIPDMNMLNGAISQEDSTRLLEEVRILQDNKALEERSSSEDQPQTSDEAHQSQPGASQSSNVTMDPPLEVDPESDLTFEQLFDKFAALKIQAMSLQGDERKKFAADVVYQFCRAMGLPEDECEPLDSDCD